LNQNRRDTIARKIATVPVVFTHGEDERLARAVLSIVNRSDFDHAAFASWAAQAKPPRLPATPTSAELSGAQNLKNFLAKLSVLLDADSHPSDTVQSARESVRIALRDAF